MKIYAMMTIMLLAISGCTTTYKGSIDGASSQPDSKSNKNVVINTGEHSPRP